MLFLPENRSSRWPSDQGVRVKALSKNQLQPEKDFCLMESFPKKNKVIHIPNKKGIYPLRGFAIFYE
jgi:hypothetical protein